MAAALRPSLLPQCSSCTRRFADIGLGAWRPSFQQQVRGKKKLVNKQQPHSIPVRLLKDVKAFGRKGSIVPVPAGMMRNNWFPARMADYVTAAEKKELKAKDIAVERDFFFGTDEDTAAQSSSNVLDIPKVNPIDFMRLSPDRSMELIENFVPPRLDFSRPVIEAPAPEEPAPQRPVRGQFSAAADVLAAASMSAPKQKAQETAIHGSVSTADIASSIRALLADNEEASRVVLSETDVHFISGTTGEDTDRVKHVGEFEVEIKVKGADEGIKRRVRVKAAE